MGRRGGVTSRPIPLGGRPTNWEDDHSCRGSDMECELHIRLPSPGVLHQGSRIPRTPGLGFEHQ